MVLSYAVTDIAGQKPKTWSPSSPQRMQISLIYISRAYFNAAADPLKPSYVELGWRSEWYMCSLEEAHVRYAEGGRRMAV